MTAVAFGLFHANFDQLFFATIIGFGFGYLTFEYSIWWAIFYHIFNNLVLSQRASLPRYACEYECSRVGSNSRLFRWNHCLYHRLDFKKEKLFFSLYSRKPTSTWRLPKKLVFLLVLGLGPWDNSYVLTSLLKRLLISRGWDKSPSLSIFFGLSSKTQWLSGLYYADFISFYSPTQLCGEWDDEIEF